MKKFLLSSAIAVTFALFSACGDDSSSGPEEIESSSSVEAEDESSSSVEEESSSSEEEIESSSEEESSSSDVIASSSSAKQSSSSAVSFTEGVKESGYYACGIYNCVTTDYLKSGITYGEILDTRDNQVYKVVTIGTQTWMAQNLNYDPGNVSSMGEYAWSGCYGEGNESYTKEQVAANCSKYGRLYTWEVAMDDANCAFGKTCSPSGIVQGICPEGWHLPSSAEWDTLFSNVGGRSSAGVALKSVDGWSFYPESTEGKDTYGFAVLPAGNRRNDGYFVNAGNDADFWSSTECDSDGAYDEYFSVDYSGVDEFGDTKNFAFSVRCLRNS